jgi:hypothetical protein
MVLGRRCAHDRGMTHPRRLSFAVGTSLLTLSASLAIGCKPKIVNEGPHQPVHVNEGPVAEQPDAEEPDAEQPDAEQPDTEAPVDDPDVDGPSKVNMAHVPE